MLLLCTLVVFLAVVGLSLLIHASCAAPEGVEDERGFYLAAPGEAVEPALPPSLVTTADLAFFRH